MGRMVVQESGIMADLMQDRTVEGISRQENVQELMDGMHDFLRSRQEEGDEKVMLTDFLSDVALLTDQDNTEEDDTPKVTLMTVHAAKGLEFDTVFIVGMEEQLFPSMMAYDSTRQMEEERRLLYVAITRAEQRCLLSYAKSRFRFGKVEYGMPSRFLKEIDKQFLKANFNIEELHGRNRWERAAVDDDDDIFGRREQRPQQRYDTRRGEVPMRNFGGGAAQPRPHVVTTPPIDPQRAGMRSVGTRQGGSGVATPAGAPLAVCAYSIGERVAHPKFGSGTIERIEPLATDHKVVINFDSYGSKTLLANYAKLTKL